MLKMNKELKKVVEDYKNLQTVYNTIDNMDFNNVNKSDILDSIQDQLGELEELSIFKIGFMTGTYLLNDIYFLGSVNDDLQGILEEEADQLDCVLNIYDMEDMEDYDADYLEENYIYINDCYTDNAYRDPIEELTVYDLLQLID